MNRYNFGTEEKNTFGVCVTKKKVHSLGPDLNDFEGNRSLCLQARTYFVIGTKDIWLHDSMPKQMFMFCK